MVTLLPGYYLYSYPGDNFLINVKSLILANLVILKIMHKDERILLDGLNSLIPSPPL